MITAKEAFSMKREFKLKKQKEAIKFINRDYGLDKFIKGRAEKDIAT